MFPRRPALAGLLLAALAAPATTAQAATTVGQLAASPIGDCGQNYSIGLQSVRTTPGLSMPTAGVVTSWSTRGDTDPAPNVSLMVWRDVSPPDPGFYNFVGATTPQAVPATVVSSFPTRIPVRQGDVLALRSTGGVFACFGAGAPTDRVSFNSYTNPVAAPNFEYQFASPSVIGYILNATATLEPDADSDGFGDETQDLCATDASTQGTCPAPPVPPGDPAPPAPPADPAPTPTTPAPPAQQPSTRPPALTLATPTLRSSSRGRATATFAFPAAGRLSWTGRASGRTVVSGSRAVPGARQAVSLPLNAAGRKLLKGKKRLSVTVTFTYTPSGRPAITRRATVVFRP